MSSAGAQAFAIDMFWRAGVARNAVVNRNYGGRIESLTDNLSQGVVAGNQAANRLIRALVGGV
jgi:hypothetical protein